MTGAVVYDQQSLHHIVLPPR